MAAETRVKNIFLDVLFLLDSTIDFNTTALTLTGQTFIAQSKGRVTFSTANLVLSSQVFRGNIAFSINYTTEPLTLIGQTFSADIRLNHPRSMFFHF